MTDRTDALRERVVELLRLSRRGGAAGSAAEGYSRQVGASPYKGLSISLIFLSIYISVVASAAGGSMAMTENLKRTMTEQEEAEWRAEMEAPYKLPANYVAPHRHSYRCVYCGQRPTTPDQDTKTPRST